MEDKRPVWAHGAPEGRVGLLSKNASQQHIQAKRGEKGRSTLQKYLAGPAKPEQEVLPDPLGETQVT